MDEGRDDVGRLSVFHLEGGRIPGASLTGGSGVVKAEIPIFFHYDPLIRPQ